MTFLFVRPQYGWHHLHSLYEIVLGDALDGVTLLGLLILRRLIFWVGSQWGCLSLWVSSLSLTMHCHPWRRPSLVDPRDSMVGVQIFDLCEGLPDILGGEAYMSKAVVDQVCIWN